MAEGGKIEGGLMRNDPAIGIVLPTLPGDTEFAPAKVASSEKGRMNIAHQSVHEHHTEKKRNRQLKDNSQYASNRGSFSCHLSVSFSLFPPV